MRKLPVAQNFFTPLPPQTWPGENQNRNPEIYMQKQTEKAHL